MTSLATPLFDKFIADDVKNHFSTDANVYFAIGRSLEFGADPNTIPRITFTTADLTKFYRNLVGAKKIQASDMQIVISRRDWTANTVYDAYSDTAEMYSFDRLTSLGTANANANVVLTGTVNVSSNIVVGNTTGSNTTYFVGNLFSGDVISVNNEIKQVVSVTNNAYLVVNTAFTNSALNATLTFVQNNTIVFGNSANFLGNVEAGNTIVIGTQSKEVVAVRSNKVITLNSALTYSNSNVSISRKDNTYPQYAKAFYVRNERDQVFKCLYNNANANSTIQPTIDIDGQLPENAYILTADGYKWKYLYTIAPGLKQRFFNETWMPVANDAAVLAASVAGRIDIVNVLWGGSGHFGGGSINSYPILSVVETNGANANVTARVESGVITAVNILNGGDNYRVGRVAVNDVNKLPTAAVQGTINVAGTVVRGNASNVTYFTGNVFVNDVLTVNGESRNVVTVVNSTYLTVNTAFTYGVNTGNATISRSNALFDIEFTPFEGHGSFPAEELGARSIMITTELDGDENDTIPVSDVTNTFDFNQIMILQNPLLQDGNIAANSSLRAATRVLVSEPGISNFIDDETVYIGSSLSSATMVANVAHWVPADNYLYINNITGPVTTAAIIKGATSGIVTTVLEVEPEEFIRYSGQVLYVENKRNIVRDQDQSEQIKVVLSF